MKHSRIFTAILIILFCFHAVVCATDRLVPSQYPTIQSAIDAAVEGDTVIVAPDTYTGAGLNSCLEFRGYSITVRSIDPNDPDIIATTIIDCVTTGNVGFNCGSNTANSTIAGFTIINGSQGIRCVQANPTIANCVISGHTTPLNGGGIHCVDNSNPTINNCTITGNTTANSAPGYGNGGGISCDDNSNPVITNCVITNNRASGKKGGGIYFYQSSPTIKNCTISENLAQYGGGFYNDQSFPTVSNCIISKNKASDGGGIYGIYGGGITNCTVIDNTAGDGGGIFCHTLSNFVVENCILRGNSPDQIGHEEPEWAEGTPVSYTNIEGGWIGNGNIDADPCFVNPDANDYHLLSDSPCINAGDPNYIPGPNETDLDGRPRVIDGRIDMGAYEFLLNTIPIADAGPNQIAYAWIDDIADVNLDGSNSYDEDGDPLNCLWSWIIDSNTYEANGISPTIQLPVGEHTVTLIVNDGYEDSEPNDVVITVTEPIETSLKLTPGVINRDTSGPQKITVRLDINPDIDTDLLDLNALLTIYPGEVPALEQRLMGRGKGMQSRSCIMASFDKQELLDAVNENGYVELSAVSQLITGQFIFASDTILIKSRNR